MNKIKITTAGESHGPALIGIIEGLPANLKIDIDKINKELLLRQDINNRSSRQKIEKDLVIVKAGLLDSKTIASPLCLEIINNDYQNWNKILNYKVSKAKKITIPRPGHADFVGYKKYNFDNIRFVIERASARKTAMDVAIGNVFVQFLEQLNIKIEAKVNKIGDQKVSSVKQIVNIIEETKIAKDTIGGEVKVVVKNLPATIGSYVSDNRKIDALIAKEIISINSVKGIMFGKEIKIGSKYNDQIMYKDNKITYLSNNTGGIEGGMSNGQNINFNVFIKPIPTTLKPLKSIDLKTKTNVKSRYERSDVSIILAILPIIKAKTAIALSIEIFNSLEALEDFNTLKKDNLWKK